MIVKIKQFLNNKFHLCFTVILLALMYWGHAFSMNIGIDVEQYINHIYGKEWLLNGLGRFGTYYSIMLTNLFEYNPFMNGFMFLISFCSAVIVWSFVFYLLGIHNQMALIVFSTLFITNPIWAYQLYFSHQQAAIMLAFLLQGLGALLLYLSLDKRNNKYIRVAYMILAGLGQVWAFGTYQSFVSLALAEYTTLVLLLYRKDIQFMDQQIACRKWTNNVLIYGSHFLVSFACYELILQVKNWGVQNISM